MEKQKMTPRESYVRHVLKPKYEALIRFKDYGRAFTDRDGLYFYTLLTEMGVFKPTKEQKQQEWSRMKSTFKQWWHNPERRPEEFEMMNVCKANIFRTWISNHANKLTPFDDVIKK